MLKKFMNFLFESFGISASGETPEERRWREFREQQQRHNATNTPSSSGAAQPPQTTASNGRPPANTSR